MIDTIQKKFQVTDEMRQYISAIRNSDKKDYALRYAIWLMRGDNKDHVVEPQPFHLTYMAAQAVRMRLEAIKKSV